MFEYRQRPPPDQTRCRVDIPFLEMSPWSAAVRLQSTEQVRGVALRRFGNVGPWITQCTEIEAELVYYSEDHDEELAPYAASDDTEATLIVYVVHA